MTPEMLDSIIADLCGSPDLKFSQRYAIQRLRKERNDLQSQLAAASERARIAEAGHDAANESLRIMHRSRDAANERADGLQRIVDEARELIAGDLDALGIQESAVHAILTRLDYASAPVPAQPAVVPKHAADWFHDMREVLFDIATSDVICDRPEHAFVTVAIDRDTLSRAAILSTTDTEVKK